MLETGEMNEEEKEGFGFLVPPKKKVRKGKKLLIEEQVFEPADTVWDEEEIPIDIEDESPLPEKEDESLPL